MPKKNKTPNASAAAAAIPDEVIWMEGSSVGLKNIFTNLCSNYGRDQSGRPSRSQPKIETGIF